MRSLRTKLTLVNLLLLLLGVAAAIVVSLMTMQHYLLERVDAELLASRTALEKTGFTQSEIDSIQAIATLVDHVGSPRKPEPSGLPRSHTVLIAVDAQNRPIPFARLEPTARQRNLAHAVRDPAALAASRTVRNVTVDGEPYRVAGSRLDDGTIILTATGTGAVHSGIRQALKLDIAFGAFLLALLAVITTMGTRHLVQPLEGMVETASAIAEGDLTRRVPAGRHPVNEIEQLRVALNSMLHQVESAFETRERSAAQLRRFVADASHELRTPLSAIRGYLQLYDRGMLRRPADRARALARMNTEADRMGRLVEELLTLARLDRQPEVRMGSVDVSRLVRDAAHDLVSQQPDRPVTVRAEGAATVRGDESGLGKVVGNLLSNVRVHTPAGAPVLVEVVREPDATVRLLVSDQGPGMAPEDADRIFDRFFRAGSGGGSGLGMAIVHAVIAAHDGEVTVRTAPGKGLTVTVTLPPP
ncbi:sensor histidine kinase [Streptomyces sp. NPDC004609]|uniref:sensor histidine kinase n=1 Tax=Streptomyces sp. NPDC004609 TaxID=3364704 RepID=UPI0036A6B43B